MVTYDELTVDARRYEPRVFKVDLSNVTLILINQTLEIETEISVVE